MTGRALAVSARVACAGALLVALVTAARSAEMAPWLTAIAAGLFAGALWSPARALPVALAIAPFGAMLAGVPVRATEAVLYAFLAGWLLRLHEPLDPASRVPRSMVSPAVALAITIVASWVVIVTERSVGLAPWPLVLEVVRTLPAGYLVEAGRDPQAAAAFQLLLAIALCLAVPALAGKDDRLPRRVAVAVASAGLIAAAATLAGVPLRYVLSSYDPAELTRYLSGARFSAHLRDLNAAGSHYALAGLVALAFARERGGLRFVWIAGLVLLLPAFWLSGSRTAMLAAAGGLPLAWAVWSGRLRSGSPVALPRRTLAIAAIVAVAAAAGSAAWLADRGRESGRNTAARSMTLRQQFAVTSARMVASAPVFGVGVGKYYERSGDFMPEQIRKLYGRENAHNYFAQVTAELGIVGGVLFLWFVGAVLLGLWRNARNAVAYDVRLALFTGCVAFLLTCVAGHPLLVVEAAAPFWAAMGAGVALMPAAAGPGRRAVPRWLAATAAILVAVTLPLRASERLRDGRADLSPRGLHDDRRDEAGHVYRWTSDHAVVFVGREPGLVILPVRARTVPGIDRPFEMTVAVSGNVEARVTVPADRWLPVTLVLRGEAPARMRRLDLRVNQTWSAKRNFGDPADARPMGVMLGPIEYRPRPTVVLRSAR